MDLACDIRKEDWLEKRTKGISGTDAAVLCGLSPFMTNVQLWEQKRNPSLAATTLENKKMKFGKEAEPILINLFEIDYPDYCVERAQPYTLATKPGVDWCIGTPDAYLYRANKEKKVQEKGILEIKTSTIFNNVSYKSWEQDIPPIYYYIQVIHYMLVVEEAQFCVLRAYVKDPKKKIQTGCIKDFTIERGDSEAEISDLFDEEKLFFQQVKDGICPPQRINF